MAKRAIRRRSPAVENRSDESRVPKNEQEPNVTVVPVPAVDSPSDHQRVRSSNDRDQQLEREGEVAPHNEGYDEVADLIPTPKRIEADE